MKKLVALLVLGSAAVFGAITPCSSSESAVTGFSGSGNGCSQVDLSFENFTVINNGTSGGYTVPTRVDTNAYVTGTTTTSGDTVGAINLFLSDGTGASWSSTTGSVDWTFNQVAYAHTGGSYPSPATPGASWYFDALSILSIGEIINNNTPGNTVTIMQTVCLDATTTSGCAASNLATIQAQYIGSSPTATYSTVSCGGSFVCSGATFDILDSVHSSVVAISTEVTVTHANTRTITIGDFGTSFTEIAASDVPEPGTFAMMGGALAGLALLVRRQRR